MTTLTLRCRACGSADVEYLGYDDEATALYTCFTCGEVQSRAELDEEWESSFDLSDDDDISGNPDLTEVSGGYD